MAIDDVLAQRGSGPKPSHSRYARYRKRHPEYVARERARLERLRARHTGDVAS
jgi:hypothetical protein